LLKIIEAKSKAYQKLRNRLRQLRKAQKEECEEIKSYMNEIWDEIDQGHEDISEVIISERLDFILQCLKQLEKGVEK